MDNVLLSLGGLVIYKSAALISLTVLLASLLILGLYRSRSVSAAPIAALLPLAFALAQGAKEQTMAKRLAELVRDAFIVKESYLKGSFEAAEGRYGSLEGYLEEGLKVPAGLIAEFREKMLEN